jgi:hypothetical protein
MAIRSNSAIHYQSSNLVNAILFACVLVSISSLLLGFFTISTDSSAPSTFYIGTASASTTGPFRKALLAERALTASRLGNRSVGGGGSLHKHQHFHTIQDNKKKERKNIIANSVTVKEKLEEYVSTSLLNSTFPIIDLAIGNENSKKRENIGNKNDLEQEKSYIDRDNHYSRKKKQRELPPLLVIGIPSIRRNGDVDYVLRTVRYIKDQLRSPHSTMTHETGSDLLNSPYPLRVRILVMNNQRGEIAHKAFEQVLSTECGLASHTDTNIHSDINGCETITVGQHHVYSKKNGLVVMARNGIPIEENLDELSANINIPSGRVRQQARDVMSLLDLANQLFGYDIEEDEIDKTVVDISNINKRSTAGIDGLLSMTEEEEEEEEEKEKREVEEEDSKNNKKKNSNTKSLRMSAYMFMEDDFRLCPQGFESIALAIHRAKSFSMNWNAIRISYGLNGAIIRGEDVSKLSQYYQKRYTMRPPDHLLVEWFAGETVESAVIKKQRPHMSYRFNLLEHFGYTSSLRSASSSYFPYCYQLMDDKVVFDVEAFKMTECSHDVLWPCLQPTDTLFVSVLNHTKMDFDALIREGIESTIQTW